MATTVEVFDPPQCCATGVCGAGIDPALARFAADLDWLAGKGVTVKRFNLAHQAAAFASHPTVKEALAREGTGCLPLILVDDRVVSRGSYPSRASLAGWVGVPVPAPALALPISDSCGGGPSSCC